MHIQDGLLTPECAVQQATVFGTCPSIGIYLQPAPDYLAGSLARAEAPTTRYLLYGTKGAEEEKQVADRHALITQVSLSTATLPQHRCPAW